MSKHSSDQSASMGRTDSEEEADTSFLDEDFLSFSATDNGGSKPNGRKRSRSTSPVPDYNNGRFVDISVPWLDRSQKRHGHNTSGSSGRGYNSYYEPPPLIKLHNEMVSFVKLMEPTRQELEIRDVMVKRVQDLAVRTFGKKCKVLPFGSQVTGLCLPNSDIDFVIRFPDKNTHGKSKSDAIDLEEDEDEVPSNPLHTFAKAVREEFGVKNELGQKSEKECLSYLEVIEQTRVPLVKFTIEPYNIDIDVCFDQPGGPESADLMHRFMGSMAPLRPLTFVLKYYLASRELNKPFTGGIGSYLLQLMIVSFLQQRSREDLNRSKGGRMENSFNLGSLLVDFLEFYGLDYNYYTTGISVRNDGYYFAKGERDKKGTFWQPSRPFSIAMENPLDPSMDVGAGAYRIQTIQRVFQHSFQTLLAYVAEPREPTDSILARIIPPTEEMEKRRLMKLKLAEEEGAASKSEGVNNGSNRKSRWDSPKKKKSEKRDMDSRWDRPNKRKSERDSDSYNSGKRKKDRRDSGGSKSKHDKRR